MIAILSRQLGTSSQAAKQPWSGLTWTKTVTQLRQCSSASSHFDVRQSVRHLIISQLVAGLAGTNILLRGHRVSTDRPDLLKLSGLWSLPSKRPSVARVWGLETGVLDKQRHPFVSPSCPLSICDRSWLLTCCTRGPLMPCPFEQRTKC